MQFSDHDGMTPLWIPLVASAIGVLGTLAGGLLAYLPVYRPEALTPGKAALTRMTSVPSSYAAE